MVKIKTYCKLNLLAVVLFLVGVPMTNAKDLDFTSLSPCQSDTQQYEINFDNVGALEWIIEGGVIISLDGRNESLTPQDMFATYMGSQWYTVGNHNIPIDANDTYSYTRIKFDGNKRMEARCYVATSSAPHLFDGSDNARHSPSLSNNPLKKITVIWYAAAWKRTITCKGDGLGAVGFITGKSGEVEKTIQVYHPVPNFNIAASNTLLNCNQGIQVDGAPYDAAYYTNTWNVPNGIISKSWNSGIYIDHFNSVGTIPVTVIVSNVCGESVTKSINLTITQLDVGHVTQNGNNVDVSGSVVVPSCQGDFYLAMPWVSGSAHYTWSLPDWYNAQTNTYSKVTQSGNNIRGVLPLGALTDFVGTVTITGVCGPPVVKTFIVRPSLQPSVDADIYSCSHSALIKVNNPNAGNTKINPYIVTPPSSSGWSSVFSSTNNTSTIFTAAAAGDYQIAINLTDASGCYTRLVTTVHTINAGNNNGSGGVVNGNATSSAAGWQAGVLSDNRVKPGSNLAIYNSNIYFGGRDGKIYFYSYDSALQKWVINQIPGITNAAIPAASSFNKIGIVTFGTVTYLFYTDNAGFFKKVDLNSNTVSEGIGSQLVANDVVATGNDIYVLEKNTNILKTIIGNSVVNVATLPTVTLKVIVPGYGVTYIQNNNLYSTALGQLTYTNDVYVTSDVVAQNGYVYYARGQKGSANLFRLSLNNIGAIEQITTATNLSGVFTINPTTGVIYYGVLDSPTFNTTYTVTSGAYKAANIYQAHLQGSTWLFNAATLVKPRENLDMYIQSPIFNGNHVFYIGAGHNNAIGDSFELEVWNLYYENACAPALQRMANTAITEEVSATVIMYPNPFTNTLQLDLSAYTDTETGVQTTAEVNILDASGKLIYTTTLLSELTAISTTDWASGIYLVKIKHNGTILTKKAVKIN